MEYVAFLLAHKTEVIAIIGGIVTTASVIVKLTPTQKDDAVLAKLIKILSKLAINPK